MASKKSALRSRKRRRSVSHLRRPAELEPVEWQRQLRRQFGRDQNFSTRNLGEHSVFSEFLISNPTSKRSYRVAIRGSAIGDNYCACPDFATNDLGTCKHIEFLLGRLERNRTAARLLRAGFQPTYSEIHLKYGGERQVRFRIGSACPAALRRRVSRVFGPSPERILPVEGYSGVEGIIAAARRCGHELRCYDDALAYIARTRDAERRRQVIDAAFPRGARSPGLRTLVSAELYPYQAEGVLFAARAGRCLLGDDMGLGKTVQAIAAAEVFTRHLGAERVLVVCPVSLKHQWQRELVRFTGREALVVSGLRARRREQYAEPGAYRIVNYELLAKDLEPIQKWSPDVVIVDEAQRIKNWNTIAARALKQIDSPYAIVLTGTPLENRLEDLLSIVQFVDQHRLGPTWRLRHDHQALDETGRVIGYRNLDRIGKTLAPIMLRRRKSEVLKQLPPRIDNTVFVPMSAEQRAHHDENGEVVARIVRRWRNTGYLSDADQRRLTCCLQNMRMSCNSTWLLDHKTDHGGKADELATLLDELFVDPQAKAVVFSQWLGTHEMIIRRLQRAGWDHVLFHGGVPGDKRGELVDRFRDDPACRVFLSTDAGGLGLNLQHAASTVINMDQPWNPAVLEQRIGRVYRLGQTRSVQVVNFVAESTIEERMLSLLAFKRALFVGVLDGGDTEVFLGGTRLTKFMESVEAVAGDKPVDSQPQLAGPAPAQTEAQTGAPQHSAAPPVAGASQVEGSSAVEPDAMRTLLDAGAKFLEVLAAGMSSSSSGAAATVPAVEPGATAPVWLESDPHSGRTYLKLPMPAPEQLRQLTEALGKWAAALPRC